MKRLSHMVRTYPVRCVLAVVFLAVIVYVVWPKADTVALGNVIANQGDIVEQVRVTGKITPLERVDLGFEKAGTVGHIYVKVGDIVERGALLASLSSQELYAAVKSAEANLLAEQASLAELQKGTRLEEVAVTETELQSATTAAVGAQRDLAVAVRDVYLKNEDAIRNKVDVLFSNVQTANPTINIRTRSNEAERALNFGRIQVGEWLTSWQKLVSGTFQDTAALNAAVATSKSNAVKIKAFLDMVSDEVNDLTPNNSALSADTISTYRSLVLSAQTEVTTAASSLLTAENAARAALAAQAVSTHELALKKSGATPEALQVQDARVKQAEANLLSAQAAYAKSTLLAPIAGTVTVVEPKEGETAAAGQHQFTIMTVGTYKIEVHVPEADIAKISVGNAAQVTLDAYGPDIAFPAAVTAIEPAETIVEGVPTYKVTLTLNDAENKIRSGMTANITITTRTVQGVRIPARALYEKDGARYVKIENAGKAVETQVETGVRGFDGLVEIRQGVHVGDKVVVPQ